MASSRSRSRTSSQSGSKSEPGKKGEEKSEKLNPGLPQLNKARKMDFKKMKKQRRRRGMVPTLHRGQKYFNIALVLQDR